MAHFALDEEWLIVFDERDDVAGGRGNIAVVDDREAGCVEVVADARDASARNGRTDGSAVEHSGKAEIVSVFGGAGRFADPVLAGDAGADCWHPDDPCEAGAEGYRWFVV